MPVHVAATSSKTGGYIYFCPKGRNANESLILCQNKNTTHSGNVIKLRKAGLHRDVESSFL